MKKIYIFIGLVALALLIIGGRIISVRFENENYRAEVAKYLAKAVQAETLRAEMDGIIAPLGRERVDYLLQVLTWGKYTRKLLPKAPDAYHGKIVLYMEDLTLTVYALDGYRDAVTIEKDIGGNKRWYFLEDYNLFQWVLKATGLDVPPENE